MRSSKDLFQTSPSFQGFKAMRESTAFEPACNAAILGLIESLPTAADPAKAWDCYLQIVGARKAFEILSNLHVPETQEKMKAQPTPYDHINTPKHRP